MAATTIKLEDAEKFFGDVIPKAIKKGAVEGAYSAAIKMVNAIQTQIIPQTTPSPVDRSIYKAGWRAEKEQDGAYYENTTPQAAFIEGGVRAANVKPGRTMIDALAKWVTRKGGASKGDARRAAFAIAVSMASQMRITTRAGRPIVIEGGGRGIFKGGQGLRIMERANDQLLEETIREEVRREVKRALGGAG